MGGSSSSHGNRHPARHDPIRPLSQQKLQGRVRTGSARATLEAGPRVKAGKQMSEPGNEGEAGGGVALPSGLGGCAEAEAVSTSHPGPPSQLAETCLHPEFLVS